MESLEWTFGDLEADQVVRDQRQLVIASDDVLRTIEHLDLRQHQHLHGAARRQARRDVADHLRARVVLEGDAVADHVPQLLVIHGRATYHNGRGPQRVPCVAATDVRAATRPRPDGPAAWADG